MFIPESATQYGFTLDGVGAHSSRTMMLKELRMLLQATPKEATQEEYYQAIVEKNVLQKRTESTRKESFTRLRLLYGISPDALVFSTLRKLWDQNSEPQPVIALCCVLTRDPILRTTWDFVTSLPIGEQVKSDDFERVIEKANPDRFNPTSLATLGRNLSSSWKQSGHLGGQTVKIRAKVESHPTSTTYAIFLGFLCGLRGEALLNSSWVRLFDESEHAIRDSCIQASKQGWLEYRHAGGITDITFHDLLQEGLMSEIDDLLQAYSDQVSMEWKTYLSGEEKIWFVVYNPNQERRVRLRLGDFEIATKSAGQGWSLVDITDSFGQWMSDHEYRESYFEDPQSLEIDLPYYEEFVRKKILSALQTKVVDENTVIAVLGVGTLFGFTKVSSVLENLTDNIQGRLVVFFPGRHEGQNYRLLDARDGWDYLAIPIKAK